VCIRLGLSYDLRVGVAGHGYFADNEDLKTRNASEFKALIVCVLHFVYELLRDVEGSPRGSRSCSSRVCNCRTPYRETVTKTYTHSIVPTSIITQGMKP